jgi:hypothetical protein
MHIGGTQNLTPKCHCLVASYVMTHCAIFDFQSVSIALASPTQTDHHVLPGFNIRKFLNQISTLVTSEYFPSSCLQGSDHNRMICLVDLKSPLDTLH